MPVGVWLLGMLAAWLCRVPVRVYVVRGFRIETATGWRRRLFRSLEWVAIRCANHVVFNSRSLMAVGTSVECRDKVAEYIDAGVTCPILYPLMPDIKPVVDAFA